MKEFGGKIAVVTGAGTGMGRELARQLSAEGCHVAICDVLDDTLAEAAGACRAGAPAGTLVTAHRCDVASEADVLRFRDEVLAQHATDHIHLLFNNAGIGGGGSFLLDDRAEWERTFGVDFYGVYYCTRAFLPLLVASPEGFIVNTSSVNGFWATLGPATPHTAYSTAKFAVKGFTEALMVDLRLNAPHVKAAVVMPGHIGTSIAINTRRILGTPEPEDMTKADLERVRDRMRRQGVPVDSVGDDEIRAFIRLSAEGFRDNAPVTSAQAATVILDGVRNDRWRILVGADAERLDRLVRADPEAAYELSFVTRLQEEGNLGGILGRGAAEQRQT